MNITATYKVHWLLHGDQQLWRLHREPQAMDGMDVLPGGWMSTPMRVIEERRDSTGKRNRSISFSIPRLGAW